MSANTARLCWFLWGTQDIVVSVGDLSQSALYLVVLERGTGIEPAPPAWKDDFTMCLTTNGKPLTVVRRLLPTPLYLVSTQTSNPTSLGVPAPVQIQQRAGDFLLPVAIPCYIYALLFSGQLPFSLPPWPTATTKTGSAMFAEPNCLRQTNLVWCWFGARLVRDEPHVQCVFCLRSGENRFPPRSRPTQTIPHYSSPASWRSRCRWRRIRLRSSRRSARCRIGCHSSGLVTMGAPSNRRR